LVPELSWHEKKGAAGKEGPVPFISGTPEKDLPERILNAAVQITDLRRGEAAIILNIMGNFKLVPKRGICGERKDRKRGIGRKREPNGNVPPEP